MEKEIREAWKSYKSQVGTKKGVSYKEFVRQYRARERQEIARQLPQIWEGEKC